MGQVKESTEAAAVPSFVPRLALHGSRRLGGLDDMIISLYAGGMTIRDIQLLGWSVVLPLAVAVLLKRPDA